MRLSRLLLSSRLGFPWICAPSLSRVNLLKSSQRRNTLSIEGRWKELDPHFERAAKTFRPFVWLRRHYLLPGTVAAHHASFLFNQGRLEEALAKTDQAIRQPEGKPRIFRHIYRSQTFHFLGHCFIERAMILTEFGRYGEARAVAAQLQQLKGLGRGPNPALALLEYQCGHLDEALAEAQAVPPTDPKYEIMRGITALAHSTKGDFDQAIQALMCEPGVIGRSYPSIDIEKAIRTTAGAKLIELERMKLAGVFPPFRLLMRASVYLAREDFESANGVLDQAEIVMGPEPGIQALYCHHHACSLADQGKTDEVENYLERLCAIVRQLPKRSLLWESHFAAGRSYLQLGRPGAALVELIAAQQFTLHLLEKHTTAYWIARAHEAAGDWPKAMPFYQIVAADPIPSWMRKKPAEALNRHA